MRLFVVVILLACASAALADEVKLKNGKAYPGTITQESDAFVSIISKGAEYMFARGEIETIERDVVVPGPSKNKKAPKSAVGAPVVWKMGSSRHRRAGRRPAFAQAEEPDAEAPREVVATAPKEKEAVRARPPFRGSITLYGTTWCGVCKQARQYMHTNGIAFQDRDVDNDPSAAWAYQAILKRANLQNAVPLIDVDGRYIQGFSPDSLDAAMAHR